MKSLLRIRARYIVIAATAVAAITLFSCKDKIPVASELLLEERPSQTIEGMEINQYSHSTIDFIATAPTMEKFSEADPPYDSFPDGIVLRAYTPEGLIETKIVADYAKRLIEGSRETIWEAYGNVVINNYIKGEKMETDTLYWDRVEQKIYTHTLVKLTTPDIFMQGYGMESDELARNAVIKEPFDSYAFVGKDSTKHIYIDSANFIGPPLRVR
ncbi:MAG: LPS export ABC transporter periplasmic protein LptC [Bacteroidales bacterium]